MLLRRRIKMRKRAMCMCVCMRVCVYVCACMRTCMCVLCLKLASISRYFFKTLFLRHFSLGFETNSNLYAAYNFNKLEKNNFRKAWCYYFHEKNNFIYLLQCLTKCHPSWFLENWLVQGELVMWPWYKIFEHNLLIARPFYSIDWCLNHMMLCQYGTYLSTMERWV